MAERVVLQHGFIVEVRVDVDLLSLTQRLRNNKEQYPECISVDSISDTDFCYGKRDNQLQSLHGHTNGIDPHFSIRIPSPRPTSKLMRLTHFFIVITAAFLATGALADTNAASISKVSDPSHRSLRKHHHTTDVDDEERGIKDIPLDRLNSLGRKVGVNAGNFLDNPGVAMRGMTKARVDAWIAGLKKLKKLYKQAEAPRIKNPSYRS